MKNQRYFYIFDLNNPENDIREEVGRSISEAQINSDLEDVLSEVGGTRTFASVVLD